jgi:hypothetical protein
MEVDQFNRSLNNKTIRARAGAVRDKLPKRALERAKAGA